MLEPDFINYEFWNYRVIIGFDSQLSIRPVFYSERGEIVSWDMMPSDMMSNHVEYLYEMYKEMGEAFDKPILMERDLENQFLEDDKIALPVERADDAEFEDTQETE